MNLFYRHPIILTLSTAVLAMSIFAISALADRQNVVVFTANWCASCREVIPIVLEVAGEKGYAVQVLNVESPNAPAQAKAYGLSIPTKQLPQVFAIKGSSTTNIFDGDTYSMGNPDFVRAKVLQSLP